MKESRGIIVDTRGFRWNVLAVFGSVTVCDCDDNDRMVAIMVDNRIYDIFEAFDSAGIPGVTRVAVRAARRYDRRARFYRVSP